MRAMCGDHSDIVTTDPRHHLPSLPPALPVIVFVLNSLGKSLVNREQKENLSAAVYQSVRYQFISRAREDLLEINVQIFLIVSLLDNFILRKISPIIKKRIMGKISGVSRLINFTVLNSKINQRSKYLLGNYLWSNHKMKFIITIRKPSGVQTVRSLEIDIISH